MWRHHGLYTVYGATQSTSHDTIMPSTLSFFLRLTTLEWGARCVLVGLALFIPVLVFYLVPLLVLDIAGTSFIKNPVAASLIMPILVVCLAVPVY